MALGFDYRPVPQQQFSPLPILKYIPREGQILRIDRMPGGTRATNITDNFAAVFDMDAIEVGWIFFRRGQKPDMRLFPLGQDWPDSPGHKFQRGVRLMLQLSERHGGGVCELSSTCPQLIGAIDAVHDEFLAGRLDNLGKLPVVVLAASEPDSQPEFVIAGWVERPESLVRD
jgi:hypothetical protein